jgi:DNA polymerase III subunit epsilon
MEDKRTYLFFDTETTGLPRNWRAPVTDLNNWPRMVQIAWILSDQNGNRIEADDYIIRPENFVIPASTTRVHGISTERALQEGKDLREILMKFNELVDETEFIVAHNVSFDEKILGAELLRKGIQSSFFKKRKLCTMQASTNYCRIPGPYGFKWPSCRNSISVYSARILMRLIMLLLISMPQKSVFGK